jgi:hypothetical protein
MVENQFLTRIAIYSEMLMGAVSRKLEAPLLWRGSECTRL